MSSPEWPRLIKPWMMLMQSTGIQGRSGRSGQQVLGGVVSRGSTASCATWPRPDCTEVSNGLSGSTRRRICSNSMNWACRGLPSRGRTIISSCSSPSKFFQHCNHFQ